MESCHIILVSNILDFIPCDFQLQRALDNTHRILTETLCLSRVVAVFSFKKSCRCILSRSNFEIGDGGGGTISDSILGGAQDTFSY